jgi:hypothetical protein
MITLCDGSELERFLLLVESATERFTRLVICSPYVDHGSMVRLARLRQKAMGVGCGFTLVTRRQAGLEFALASRNPVFGRRNVATSDRLHAKVYVAVARRFRESMLMITSANLTQAGIGRNCESGVLVRSNTPTGSKLIDIAATTLLQLAARHSLGGN